MPPKKTVSVFTSTGKYGFTMICPKCGESGSGICEINIYNPNPETIDQLFEVSCVPTHIQCLDCGFVGEQDLFIPKEVKSILDMKTMKEALQ